jgi:hypothetical protein
MTLKFLCPSGHRLKADPRDSAMGVVCPTCGHEVIVPRLEDLDGSALQDEDSATFVGVSVDADNEIVSVPTPPLLPPRPLPVNPPDLPPDEESTASSEPQSHTLPGLVHVYQPDERRLESLKWLTFVLGLIVAFSAAPIVPHLDLLAGPYWPRGILIVALLQACYLVWLSSSPDWSTIRVVMVVFFVVAASYAAAIAWIALVPAEEPLPFALEEVRGRALQWSGCVVTLMLFGAYLCARASRDWRRAVEQEMAVQGKQQRLEDERDGLSTKGRTN